MKKCIVPKMAERARVVGTIVAPNTDFVKWAGGNCPALAMCGGGCPANAEMTKGSRWRTDELACTHSNAILEWIIWDTYAQMA